MHIYNYIYTCLLSLWLSVFRDMLLRGLLLASMRPIEKVTLWVSFKAMTMIPKSQVALFSRTVHIDI